MSLEKLDRDSLPTKAACPDNSIQPRSADTPCCSRQVPRLDVSEKQVYLQGVIHGLRQSLRCRHRLYRRKDLVHGPTSLSQSGGET